MNRRRLKSVSSSIRRLPGRWSAVVLLGLSLALGLLPVPPPAAAISDELARLYADGLVICTPGGMVRVDGSGAPPVRRQITCVFCLPLSHPGGGMLAADLPVLAPSQSPSMVSVVLPNERPRSVRVRLSHAPRAPPFVANV